MADRPMKLYKHHTRIKGSGIALSNVAWINRITQTEHGWIDGPRVAELWYVILPSWGYGWHWATDDFQWGRRCFQWNSRSGEKHWGWYFG